MPTSPSARRAGLILAGLAVLAVIALAVVVFAPRPAVSQKPTAQNSPSAPTVAPSITPITPTATPSTPPTTPPPTQAPPFDKTAHSLTNPNSIWVIVNKKHPLNPKTYAPPLAALNLPGRAGFMRPEAATQLRSMFAAYHAQSKSGDQLSVVSPYRSYSTQVATYNGWVSRLGKAQADRQSARPGYSEHQSGLAVDIDTAISQSFGTTPAGSWLAKYSYKYGFIVRYQQGQEPVTGYEYEPWHFRYVGVALATEMHRTGAKSLEAFFSSPAAPNY